MFPPSARVALKSSQQYRYDGVFTAGSVMGQAFISYVLGWNSRVNDGLAQDNLYCYSDMADPACNCCGYDPYTYDCYQCGTTTLGINSVVLPANINTSITDGWYEGSGPYTGWKYMLSYFNYNDYESKCCSAGECGYPCGYSNQSFWLLGQNSGGPWEAGGGKAGDSNSVVLGNIGIKTNGTLWAWGGTEFMKYHGWNSGSKTSPYQLGSSSWKAIVGHEVYGEGDYYAAHSILAIKTDGTLWAWGKNENGQLGLGDTTARSSPVQVGTGTTWDKLAMGNFGSGVCSVLAIKTDGTLWAWGNNTYGQLAQLNTTNRSSPVQIGTGTNWDRISVSTGSCAAIKTDGTLWTWGYNGYGQLGLGDISSRSSTAQVGTGTNWSKVCVTYGGMAAIKSNNSLWVTGLASIYGTYNTYNVNYASSPAQIGSSVDYGDFTDNRQGGWSGGYTPVLISNDKTKLFSFKYNDTVRYSGCILGGPYYKIGDSHQLSIYRTMINGRQIISILKFN